jgi:hypothetical protein
MADDVFVSYSRKDQEFVIRLASDLDEKVAGVWFDQSDIQAGHNWRDQIMDGIRRCKVFVLVLSPDAAESKYVREEVNKALELDKLIIPILYRTVKLTGALAELVSQTQSIDLRSGSYADNFQKLVDGIVAAGAARQTLTNVKRPFIRQSVKTDWGAAFRKSPGWGLAWGLGWAIFWFVLAILYNVFENQGGENTKYLLLFPIGGGIGGGIGGLLAGVFTMVALRRYAPSITWKHMSPGIRIWAFLAPVGAFVSYRLLVFLDDLGMFAPEIPTCSGSIGECVGQIIGASIGYLAVLVLILLVFVAGSWFITGMIAGGLAVRAIRKLEPGITARESWSVSTGWGCGAILAAIASLVAASIIAGALGLTF